MLLATLILIPFVFFKLDLTRIWGVILTALYLTYMLMVL
jgi:cation:H+ antiporter